MSIFEIKILTTMDTIRTHKVTWHLKKSTRMGIKYETTMLKVLRGMGLSDDRYDFTIILTDKQTTLKNITLFKVCELLNEFKKC